MLAVLTSVAGLGASSPQVQGKGACLTCHSQIEVLLQRKFKHAAVDRGCTSCHVDHRVASVSSPGDNKPAHYLGARQPELCLECHPSDENLEAAHSRQPFGQAECSGCHDPHSSNFPKLAPEKSHGPYGARQCGSCHAPPQEGKVRLVTANTNELCYSCHDQLKARVESARSRHKLLSLSPQSCVEYHDPHATNHDSSLKKPAQRLCVACHAEVTAGKRYVHEPVGVSCIFCHNAHASELPHNLHARTHELCLGCHGPDAVRILQSKQPFPLFRGRVSLPPQPFDDLKYLDLVSEGKVGHPMLGHPVFAPGTQDKPELNCLTCHVPHSAANRQLLVIDKGSICSNCHRI